MEYVKAIYCHPAYLTSMQNITCESLGWMKHKLESRLLGEISISSDMQMTSPLQEESEKAGLKLNLQKTKIMASSPTTSRQTDGETMKTVTRLFYWAPKSLQIVTAAMKLKHACSLEEKL